MPKPVNKLKHMKCKVCKAKWLPRVSAPKKCPVCQTRDWDEKPVYRPVAGPARKAKRIKY